MINVIKDGKLTSVQYIIEIEDAEKEAADKYAQTPFWAAFYEGKLEVVQYLCERQNTNKEAADNDG